MVHRSGRAMRRGDDGQLDLLVALPGDIPTHDQQDMMERPFFSLSKQRRTEPIDYQVQNGSTTISVNVTAPAEIGLATIWDADILIWAASQLREAKARGIDTSPTFKVSIYELLRGIDRRTGGDEYQRIVEAFDRLSGTLIRTNIRQGRRKKPEGFHWIERSGERISSCLAESTVNAVISKRFAKRQQMQWTKRGAHLLLQTRTRTLDGTLRPLFERWYPGLANDNGNGAAQAVAA